MESSDVDLEAWITRSGLSAAQVAERAGVSGSTIHRIRNRQTDPSIGTLREIAIACGLDLEITAGTLSDPSAAEAARVLLEEGYSPTREAGVEEWISRLRRQTGSPLGTLSAAAVAADPFMRRSSIHFSGRATTAMLASAGSAAEGRWALSGTPGIDLPSRQEELTGHALLWVDDVSLVASLLGTTLRSVPSATIATVTVTPARPALFGGSFEAESIKFVAPIQIMLDCLALGGAAADAATEIVSSW